MTKNYETYYRQNIDSLNTFKTQLKGELTIVISPKTKNELLKTNYAKIEKQVIKYLKNYTVKDVVELMSKKEQIPKKIIYNPCIKNKMKNYLSIILIIIFYLVVRLRVVLEQVLILHLIQNNWNANR